MDERQIFFTKKNKRGSSLVVKCQHESTALLQVRSHGKEYK